MSINQALSSTSSRNCSSLTRDSAIQSRITLARADEHVTFG
ncbi:hypothetical protein [Nocardia sp. No.11]